jgi:hypothetical protein
MASCVLPFRPAEYLHQGVSHCGAFAVKGILSAYGKDDGRTPKFYNPWWAGKITGLATPDTWVRTLRAHGLAAQRGSAARIAPGERVALLQRLLDSNNAIMLRIGNGYLQNGGYSPLRGKLIGHWVTVWGYDDDRRVFYTYDPRVKPELRDRDLPVGNVARSFEETLRDWRGGFFLWPWRYLYIACGRT